MFSSRLDRRNAAQARVNWRLATDQARVKLRSFSPAVVDAVHGGPERRRTAPMVQTCEWLKPMAIGGDAVKRREARA